MSRFARRIQAEEKAFRAENSEIFYQLQFSLTNVSLAGLSLTDHTTESHTEADNLSLVYQILTHGTFVFPQIYQFLE